MSTTGHKYKLSLFWITGNEEEMKNKISSDIWSDIYKKQCDASLLVGSMKTFDISYAKKL